MILIEEEKYKSFFLSYIWMRRNNEWEVVFALTQAHRISHIYLLTWLNKIRVPKFSDGKTFTVRDTNKGDCIWCLLLTAGWGVMASTFFSPSCKWVWHCQIHLTNTLIITDGLQQAAPLARSAVGQPVPGESQLSPTSCRQYENRLCVCLCCFFFSHYSTMRSSRLRPVLNARRTFPLPHFLN